MGAAGRFTPTLCVPGCICYGGTMNFPSISQGARASRMARRLAAEQAALARALVPTPATGILAAGLTRLSVQLEGLGKSGASLAPGITAQDCAALAASCARLAGAVPKDAE